LDSAKLQEEDARRANRWHYSSHQKAMLGACAVTLRGAEGTLVYSGDLGRRDDHLMPPPEAVAHGDVVLIESTYGDRNL